MKRFVADGNAIEPRTAPGYEPLCFALAGCEKKAEMAAETTAETTEAATAAASEGTDADAASTEEGDPNGNPIKP